MFLIIFILVNIISIHGQVKILDAKCVNDNFPSFLCNSTFSDPRYLKTTSESVLHIGVSLKIINKNNNNANNTGFDEGFKVLIKLTNLKKHNHYSRVMFKLFSPTCCNFLLGQLNIGSSSLTITASMLSTAFSVISL